MASIPLSVLYSLPNLASETNISVDVAETPTRLGRPSLARWRYLKTHERRKSAPVRLGPADPSEVRGLQPGLRCAKELRQPPLESNRPPREAMVPALGLHVGHSTGFR